MIKKILIGIGVLFLLIQFIRPEKNDSNENAAEVSTKYHMPGNVKNILTVACNDCHSNQTRYPWYANVQPVGWWLGNHVNDGKGHLNFSEFTNLPIAEQNHNFEEIIEVLEEDEMPIDSYTYLGLHSDANLTEDQKNTIITWAKEQMSTLKSTYPPDSLVRERR